MTAHQPARVAKVKNRMPKHPQPLRTATWRRYLPDLAKWMLIYMAAAATVGAAGCVARVF